MFISVIISERGEPFNLVWTLQALEEELGPHGSDPGFIREYIVVTNGPEAEREGDKHTYDWLDQKWPHGAGYYHRYHMEEGSIYKARNLGASKATGKYLWFLDAHTMPVAGSYRAALAFKQSFEGVMHLGLRYFLDKPGRVVYGYRWKRDMFWGSWTRIPPKPPEYRILMNGGANILIDKNVWDEIDGYHPALGIYGGGEPYTDIKAQMYGYQVKSHPDMQYYHLAARKRGYHWFQTDMWRNFMITAYSLGGQKYLDMLYAGYYEKCKTHADWLKTLNETRDSAVAAAQADRDHIAATAKYTVDEVLESWREYAEIHGHETGEWPT